MPEAIAIFQPIEDVQSLKDRTYDALKQAITTMDIYASPDEPRLDERVLSEQLGVSRTPIREAIARLEQEGLVRIVPRRGVFVVRKPKSEILQMITVWAALESMAARLITEHATDDEIKSLRRMFGTFDGGDNGQQDGMASARIDEYSDTNIRFHQALLGLSKCSLISEMTENLFIHMRSIRMRTIGEDDRARRSIIDHMNIIEALESRDAEIAERLTRAHTLGLAAHVEKNVNYLD
ncbi:MAG: GntR family transcriptional regulator [Rhodospirillales bacterium]|nr:GntR family transcriptional regulator [Rhodospirillales bacterium]